MAAATAEAVGDPRCSVCGEGCWDYELRGEAVVCVVCLGDELEAAQADAARLAGRVAELEGALGDAASVIDDLEARVRQAEERTRRYRTQAIMGTPDSRVLDGVRQELAASEARRAHAEDELRELRVTHRALRAEKAAVETGVRHLAARVRGRRGRDFRRGLAQDPAPHVRSVAKAYGVRQAARQLGMTPDEVRAAARGRLELTAEQVHALTWFAVMLVMETEFPAELFVPTREGRPRLAGDDHDAAEGDGAAEELAS